MNSEEFKRLAKRISNGTASNKDIARYNFYYAYFQTAGSDELHESGKQSEIGEELRARIDLGLERMRSVKRMRFYWKAAAAIVLLVSATVLLRNVDSFRSADTVPSAALRFKYDAAPGGNNATLTLADGSTITLDAIENGNIANQHGAVVIKKQEGQLVYTVSPEIDGKQVRRAYNTISVPAGGTYQVQLPDGTKVWLNSASSLKFPTVFTGPTRKVTLEGEAYFEVTRQFKNSAPEKNEHMPFIVITDRQRVEVLGTHFNINAYSDEDAVRTTLLEGSVKVSDLAGGTSHLLKPGQQALFESNAFRIRQVDAEEAVAWKDGMFQFSNADMQTVIRQLKRWYKVEADERNMPQRRFYGAISRDVPLSKVLKMMEITSGLKFKIEDLPPGNGQSERRITMAE